MPSSADGLNAAATAAPTFQAEKTRDALFVIPTGDGMALIFHNDLTAPARCALEYVLDARQTNGQSAILPVQIGHSV